MRTPNPRGMFARACLLTVAMLTACSDSLTKPHTQSLGELVLSASVIGTPVSTLVVTVTAPDIATPLVFNIQEQNGTASATLRLPPGDNRLITVQAYDSFGQLTNQGSKTVNVVPGPNPAVSIPVIALAGQLPITVTLGPVGVAVSPGAIGGVHAGQSASLVATITAPNGDLLSQAPQWASSNPTVATVDANGVVTALAVGATTITATYEGVAGAATITVDPWTTTTVYQTDFESGAGPEWSYPVTNLTPSGRRFLGPLSNGAIELSLSNLPQHQEITISLDLYAIQTLDGLGQGEWFRFDVDGQELLYSNFANYPGASQAYPARIGAGSNPPMTGATERNTLGYTWADLGPMDAVYHLTFTVPHSTSLALFTFAAGNLEALDNESWGVDNVTVQVRQ